MSDNETGSAQRVAARALLAADRRRPGRPAHVNPELVPILRGEFAQPLPPDAVEQTAPGSDLLCGAAFATILLVLGAMLRFSV